MEKVTSARAECAFGARSEVEKRSEVGIRRICNFSKATAERYIMEKVTSANAERERYRAERSKTRSVLTLFIIHYSIFIIH